MKWAIVQDGQSGLWFRAALSRVSFDRGRIPLNYRLVLRANFVMIEGWISKNRWGPNSIDHSYDYHVDITPELLPEAVAVGEPYSVYSVHTWDVTNPEQSPAMVLHNARGIVFSSRRLRQ